MLVPGKIPNQLLLSLIIIKNSLCGPECQRITPLTPQWSILNNRIQKIDSLRLPKWDFFQIFKQNVAYGYFRLFWAFSYNRSFCDLLAIFGDLDDSNNISISNISNIDRSYKTGLVSYIISKWNSHFQITVIHWRQELYCIRSIDRQLRLTRPSLIKLFSNFCFTETANLADWPF